MAGIRSNLNGTREVAQSLSSAGRTVFAPCKDVSGLSDAVAAGQHDAIARGMVGASRALSEGMQDSADALQGIGMTFQALDNDIASQIAGFGAALKPEG